MCQSGLSWGASTWQAIGWILEENVPWTQYILQGEVKVQRSAQPQLAVTGSDVCILINICTSSACWRISTHRLKRGQNLLTKEDKVWKLWCLTCWQHLTTNWEVLLKYLLTPSLDHGVKHSLWHMDYDRKWILQEYIFNLNTQGTLLQENIQRRNTFVKGTHL